MVKITDYRILAVKNIMKNQLNSIEIENMCLVITKSKFYEPSFFFRKPQLHELDIIRQFLEFHLLRDGILNTRVFSKMKQDD